MSQGKKFGTFAGVFTPSILTILGVIMYMRLSWVVGNAGLITAITIILIAHVVSITTGLSVSSVATDRKIKAGGIYYMLSRSLGLPIGGSIGITLFVATALSIALYLIGFAESALVVLQEPLGIETISINHVRLFGSIALLVIVTIAFISTSIAIKSQFFILGAIILSIVSILFGTQEGKTFDLTRANEIESNFFVLFGIFFPAVTGFTAGVAMSGDLKDPKKSIPWGTMLAVGTGLLVYVVLAIFIYYSFDGNFEALISDKNALVTFGLVPALVIAGIWGATLSSALGGILGAPRILQAMSVDKITPSIFAKGKGAENEPRNALILTFVIAEAGILIGELDVIAEVVAMFYMSAYLFINLSCMLEQWASPDFRPSFKIPIANSLIGTIVTFLLMIQLNLVAAIVAILVMILIFIFLTRKQLVLGSGDVWQSVWSTIVKLGLKNLDKKSTHKRNWNPNILLFSGGTETRNKLIEFSKIVAGAKGMISNFDLIENRTAKLLFPKHKQSIKDEELDSKGIFARRQECKDVYEGIEAISSTYGFSGIEPNTILTSWEQSSIEPFRFAQLTQKLCDLDYNVLFLDFDKQRGFGGMKMIDIWWNDFSNTTELSLNLAKFMSSSIDWRNATIRVLYVNDDNDKKTQLEDVIHELLVNYRINAKPKIINNQIENKELYEIMKVESYDSDLVIVGIPDHLDQEEEFVNKTNELVKILGTTLLIRASSHFEETELHFEEEVTESQPKIEEEDNAILDSAFYGYSLLNNLSVFKNRNTTHLLETVFSPIYNKYLSLLLSIEETLNENQINFEKQWSSNDNANSQLLDKTFKEYVKQLSSKLEEYNTNFSITNESVFQESIESFLNQHEIYLSKLPSKITRALSEEELLPKEKDTREEKRAKKWHQFKKNRLGISPSIKVKYKKLATYYYQNYYLKIINKAFLNSGIFVFKNVSSINKLSDFIKDEYFKLRSSSSFSKDEFHQSTQMFLSKIEIAKQELENNYKTLASCLFKLNNDYIYSLSKKMETLTINSEVDINKEEKGKSIYTKQLRTITYFPVNFSRNNRLINNSIILDVSLHEIHPEIDSVIKDTITSINRLSVKPNLIQIINYNKLDTALIENDSTTKLELIKFINKLPMFSFDIDELINITIKKVEKIVYKLPRSLDIMDVDSINNFNEIQGRSVKTNTIQLQKLILFSVENKLIKALNNETDNLQNELNEKIGVFKNKTLAIESIDFDQEGEIVVELRESLRKEILVLVDEIETRFKNYISKVNEEVEETYSILDYDFIAGNSLVINKYIKNKGVSSSKLLRLLNTTKKEVKKRIKQALSFVDSQREEFMISEFRNQHKNKQNLSSIVSEFVETVKKPKAVLETIPFFYKKLFLGDHAAPVEIENRDVEILQAKQAIELLNKKFGGAIIILGEQLSGKKYFADYVSSSLLSRKVVTINPFIENKILEKSFEKTTRSVFKNENEIEENLKQTNGKTIVINDIEKWGSDLEVVNRIHNLVNVFGKKHHFIITCDLDFYTHLKEVTDIEEVFVSTIIIQPIRREGFVETLKLKHQAGGMKFILQNKLESEIPNRKKEALYQKYHAIYKGNLGRAFLGWINNIETVNENEIVINEPKSVFFPELNNPDWIVVLKLLVLHKEISSRQMNKMFEVEFPLNSILNQMKRIKLIEETKAGVFELSAEVYFYVKRYLKDKKVIE